MKTAKTFEGWLRNHLQTKYKMNEMKVEETVRMMKEHWQWNVAFGMDTDEYWDSIDPEELGPVERETILDTMGEEYLINAVEDFLNEK